MVIRTNNKGFSLVELSVVLIILGLLAAGITAGNSLVKGAKIRSVIADIESYEASVNAFKIQYDDLPGDIMNAHDYWDDGADGVCGNANQCNGNGDAEIDWGGGPNASESFRAWQHLTLAGLVPGNYTGTAGSGGNNHIEVGVNAPASKVTGNGYTLLYTGNYYGKSWGNTIEYGLESTANRTYDSGTNPRDASAIDKKIDDGLPEFGKVGAAKGINNGTNNCVIGATNSRTYKLTYESLACRMLFKIE